MLAFHKEWENRLEALAFALVYLNLACVCGYAVRAVFQVRNLNIQTEFCGLLVFLSHPPARVSLYPLFNQLNSPDR